MSTPYEQDFYTWTQEQAALIRSGRFDLVDREHLAEEVETMGRSETRELASRLALIMGHLLKWRYQIDRSPGNERSWRATIQEQRRRLVRLLEKNPGLKKAEVLADAQLDAWISGLALAVRETSFDEDVFPSECPFTWEQLLDEAYWP